MKYFKKTISMVLAVATAFSALATVAFAGDSDSVNLALGKTVLNSDAINAPEWAANNLTDGKTVAENGNNGYSSNGSYPLDKLDCNAGFTVDFGESIDVNKVIMFPRTDAVKSGTTDGAANFPKKFQIQASDDVNFTNPQILLEKDNVETTINSPVSYTFNRVKARYIRLFVLQVGAPDGGSSGRVQLTEFEIYNETTQYDLDLQVAQVVIDKIDTIPATVDYTDKNLVDSVKAVFDALTDTQKDLVTNAQKLTDALRVISDEGATLVNLALDKEVLNSDAIGAPEWAGNNLTDGKTVAEVNINGYSSNGSYPLDKLDCNAGFMVDLGESKDVNRVILYPRTNAVKKDTVDGAANFPKKFQIQASDDVNFTNPQILVDKDNVETTINKPVSYTFDRVKARYIRLLVLQVGAPDGGDQGRVQLTEFEIYNQKVQADYDIEAAQVVIDKIDTIPTTVDYTDKNLVDAVKTAFDALTDTQKELVTNVQKLTDALNIISEESSTLVNLALGKAVLNSDAIGATEWAGNNLTDGKTVAEPGNNGFSSNGSYALDKLDCNAGFTIDLGESKDVNRVILYPRTNAVKSGTTDGAANFPKKFQIQASDDENFTNPQILVDKDNVETTINKSVSYTFDRVKARYIRLFVFQVGAPDAGDQGRVQLTEFEIYNQKTQADFDAEAASPVIDIIAKLPATIILTDKDSVEDARGAFNELTDDQKAYVTNIQKLIDAEKTLVDMTKAKVVSDLIAALPTSINLSSTAKVTAARSEYNKLDAVQKNFVVGIQKLIDAEASLANINAADKVVNMIKSLGSKPSETKVSNVRKAYNALSSAQKKLVTNYSVLKAAEKKIADAKKPVVTKLKIYKGKSNVSGKKLTYKLKTKSIQLKASVIGKNLTAKHKKVKWEIDKSKIAKVSSTGKVSFKKKGKVKIIASCGGKKITLSIIIK